MTNTSTAPRKAKKKTAIEVRCSYCSCHLRGDNRKFALHGYNKFCAKCRKICVDR